MTLVLGIGNRTRGDDGVGPCVAERVAALGLPGVDVLVESEPLALVELVGAHEVVVVVDAIAPLGRPGRVHVRSTGSVSASRSRPALGSHGLGVGEAVELARALGQLPGRLTVVGIEGRVFEVGAPLSAPVRASLDEAVGAVRDALAPGPWEAIEPLPASLQVRGSMPLG